MPIHTDFKSMLMSMRKSYCKAGAKTTEVKFTDGKSIRVCKLALSRFYATCRDRKWDYTKARPKATSETVRWFLERKGIKVK